MAPVDTGGSHFEFWNLHSPSFEMCSTFFEIAFQAKYREEDLILNQEADESLDWIVTFFFFCFFFDQTSNSEVIALL